MRLGYAITRPAECRAVFFLMAMRFCRRDLRADALDRAVAPPGLSRGGPFPALARFANEFRRYAAGAVNADERDFIHRAMETRRNSGSAVWVLLSL